MFESGVSYYTAGIAKVKVFFPENEICCQWCRFCRTENEMGRFWCRLTNDLVYNPKAGILENCPIDFEEKENG